MSNGELQKASTKKDQTLESDPLILGWKLNTPTVLVTGIGAATLFCCLPVLIGEQIAKVTGLSENLAASEPNKLIVTSITCLTTLVGIITLSLFVRHWQGRIIFDPNTQQYKHNDDSGI